MSFRLKPILQVKRVGVKEKPQIFVAISSWLLPGVFGAENDLKVRPSGQEIAATQAVRFAVTDFTPSAAKDCGLRFHLCFTDSRKEAAGRGNWFPKKDKTARTNRFSS